MKTHTFPRLMLGIIALGATLALLTGCGKSGSEAPSGGYAGGQKSGATNNATTDQSYMQKARSGSPGPGGMSGSYGRPMSGGMPPAGMSPGGMAPGGMSSSYGQPSSGGR